MSSEEVGGQKMDVSQFWEKLNDVQKAAASWNGGAMLVLAGPGSGKTRVLTCRIARLLVESQDHRYRILGLTFTNKAAEEMRERLHSLAGEQEGRVFLGTFHSFCADVLRQQGVHIGIRPDFKIFSLDAELDSVLQVAVKKGRTISEKVSTLDLKILPIIQRLQKHLIMPDQAVGATTDKDLAERVAVVYGQYDAELQRLNALDFNSLILQAVRLFRQYPAIAKRYRAVYPYICVDEFQDTNYAQYELLRTLTLNKGGNIFVVADDDQIIYQWNGASYQRISEFISDFSPEILQLPLNYRCPAEVVALANNLIKHNFHRTPGKEPLIAYQQRDANVSAVRTLLAFETFADEASAIADDIAQRRNSVCGTFAVLGRRRALLERVGSELQQRGVKSTVVQRKDEFQSTPIRWLHSLLKLASDRSDQKSLEAVCGLFGLLTGCAIDPATVTQEAQGSNLGYLHTWVATARQVAEGHEAVLKRVFELLVNGRDFRAFSSFALEWFDELACTHKTVDPSTEAFTGYVEERQVWVELMREIRNILQDSMTLEGFLQELELHSKDLVPPPDCVQLMTIHASKGKEFNHVYIIGLVEDELPSFQSRRKGSESPEMEEERRSCFVALTRAVNTLTLSHAKQYNGWPKIPSRFLYEMGVLRKEQNNPS
jgi:DNA helicase-2/ATP-dependent DNA helicase PcrA